MLIATEKRNASIAEYILYMWQIENVIRSAKFDVELIDRSIVVPMALDDNQREQEIAWYSDLIKKMKEQQILSSGHLLEIRDLVVELSYLHNSLLNNLKDPNYGFAYNSARSFIKELRTKQGGVTNDEVEICLNGLYAFWMLKASKKPVSADTEKAMGAISKLIAILSAKYKEMMSAVNEVKN